jgi:hypothetical protein
MMMSEREIYMSLLGISVNTYYLWKKQQRPIMTLLEKSFTKTELEKFVTAGELPTQNQLNQELISRVDRLLNELEKERQQ